MHFKVLHIDGTVNMGGREIINRALRKEGFEPIKKRKRL